jgi:uncharacterized protein YycO
VESNLVNLNNMTIEQRKNYEADIDFVEKKIIKTERRMQDLLKKEKSNSKLKAKLSTDDQILLEIGKSIENEKNSQRNNPLESLTSQNEYLIKNFARMKTGYYFIWYNYDIGNVAFGYGHVALVDDPGSTQYSTIEANKEDGVQRKKSKYKFGRIWKSVPVGFSSTKGNKARNYSATQINKSFNWNFFDKWTEKKFYCSQLVWRAWYNQGIDIDYLKMDTIVSPMEIAKSDNTLIFEHIV